MPKCWVVVVDMDTGEHDLVAVKGILDDVDQAYEYVRHLRKTYPTAALREMERAEAEDNMVLTTLYELGIEIDGLSRDRETS